MRAGAARSLGLRVGDLLPGEHPRGVLAHPLVRVAGARLGDELDELGRHVLPGRERAQRDQAVQRFRAAQGGVGRRMVSPSASSRAFGSGSRRISSESSVRPQPSTCGSSSSHSPSGSSLTVASATAA